MKRTITIIFLLFSNSCSYSQAIRFQPLTWQQSLTKARKENKILFIDIYTTWCTYCRQMDQSTFSTKEAGDYYNEHFINVRYDALKNDGIQIRKSYTISGFPTFLYLDPNGMVLLKTTGFQEKTIFLRNGDSAVSVYGKTKALPLRK